MSIAKNIQTVKDFFAAIGRGDKEALLALVAEDIEWIIPGEDDWIFAITVRNGKLTSIREYVDTQALARASKADTNPTPSPIDTGAAQRAS
jgi:uncharacterized protein